MFLSTSGRTNTNVFPSVYTGFNTSGAPNGPSGVTGNAVYDQGDNWGVSQGGIWMSSGGASSTASASVYAASANGPFACTGSGTSQECLTAANVVYWGESMMKFPPANSSNPAFPSDFYAPNNETFTINSHGDPLKSAYETGEEIRLDLDFGSTPPVIISFTNAPEFAVSADKSGYMYVVPAEANGTGITVSLGQFQTGDVGLTSGAVSTRLPFQAIQLPMAPNISEPVCPVNDPTNWTNNGASCDEIHEIAFLNNLAIVWPRNESVEVFQGNLSQPNGSGTYNYSFNPTAVFKPCPPPFTKADLPSYCQGPPPALEFPGAGTGAPVGSMAVAASPSPVASAATLWAITPEPYEGNWGWLYAYTIDLTSGALRHC